MCMCACDILEKVSGTAEVVNLLRSMKEEQKKKMLLGRMIVIKLEFLESVRSAASCSK
jgi:hypothetical protein